MDCARRLCLHGSQGAVLAGALRGAALLSVQYVWQHERRHSMFYTQERSSTFKPLPSCSMPFSVSRTSQAWVESHSRTSIDSRHDQIESRPGHRFSFAIAHHGLIFVKEWRCEC